ncbi:hypothetical protein [Kaistia algarum]|uniref:hypothetical protein n=1 Tax=Kaistia algarum TaxID=2083279 RepID=UPI0010573F3C|nr:hypothetical protein [Kaistia algarum]MCX5513757.1 hypothetical protein [Kaistia algarum]
MTLIGSERIVYRTDPASSIAALAFGALVGGALSPLCVLAWSIIFGHGDITVSVNDIILGFYIFTVSSFVWLFGLTFLAAPIWIVLHWRNWRDARAAILFGAGLCFAVGFALFGLLADNHARGSDAMFVGGRLTILGWQSAAEAGLFLAVQGAIVGFAVWRWAYRKQVS